MAWTHSGPHGDDVRATRVRPNGEIQDPTGIAITHSAAREWLVNVVAGDESFLVIWRNETALFYTVLKADDGALATYSLPEIDVRNFSVITEGAWSGREFLLVVGQFAFLLDSEGQRVAGPWRILPTHMLLPFRVFTDGEEFLLLSRGLLEPCCGWRIYLSRVKTESDAPTPIVLSGTDPGSVYVDVSFDGEKFLILQRDGHMNRAEVIHADGSVVKGRFDTFPLTTGLRWEHAVWTGHAHFVMWQSTIGRGRRVASRIGRDGSLIDMEPFPLVPSNTIFDSDVAFAGGRILVAYSDWRFGYFNPPPSESPWVDGIPDRSDLFGLLFSPDGTPRSDEITIAAAAPLQQNPAIATDGTNVLAVWQERIGDHKRPAVKFGRIGPRGELPDGQGVLVARSDALQMFPAIASGNGHSLIVWQEQQLSSDVRRLLASRIDSEGRVLDDPPLTIAAEASRSHPFMRPAVAWNGLIYLIVWDKRLNTPTVPDVPDIDIYAARVTSDGLVLDQEGFRVSPREPIQKAPAISWNGTAFVVVWEEQMLLQCGVRQCLFTHDLAAARIGSLGEIIDSYPIRLTKDFARDPFIVCGEVNCLIAATRETFGGAVIAQTIDRHGSVSQPLDISTHRSRAGPPSVAWNGQEYLASWSEYHLRSFSHWDVMAARIDSFGNPIDAPTPVANSQGNELAASVTSTLDRRWVVAYVRYAPETPYGGVDRVFLKWLAIPRHRAIRR